MNFLRHPLVRVAVDLTIGRGPLLAERHSYLVRHLGRAADAAQTTAGRRLIDPGLAD